MVTLEELTRDNWIDCCDLEVHDEQRNNVASNVYTIAQSKFEPRHRLRAIYAEDKIVGLLAFAHDEDSTDQELFWIFRLMIDKRYQRRGIGIAAMRLAINEISELGARRIRTMHRPTNSAAAAMYMKLGFTKIGFLDDGDVLLELELP